MKGLFWVVLLFALAVGLSLVMQVNEGYVLVVLPPYRVELSINLIILMALGGFILLYALLRATALALALPRRLRESRARREREKADEVFGDGVRLYLAGELRQAIDALARLREGSVWQLEASMLAAKAAGELGAVDEQGEWHRPAVPLDLPLGADIEGKNEKEGFDTTEAVKQIQNSDSPIQR